MALEPDLDALVHGPLYPFKSWPVSDVPIHASGVYTIWDGAAFIYVGMSGRSMTVDTPTRMTPMGLFTRLASHAAGRRSGDQFCVYVADRLVLPSLSRAEMDQIAAGTKSMDALVRTYIKERLGFRFVVTTDGVNALALESRIRKGALGSHPSLNPVVNATNSPDAT